MVDVYFDWALYNAKCAVNNDVTNTREEFPDSFRRQAEPIGEHHKLIPVEKSENGGWIYEAKFSNKIVAGPYSDLKSRRVFYTCEYHRCQIRCPCMLWAGPLSSQNLVSPISDIPTHLYQSHLYQSHLYQSHLYQTHLYQTSFLPSSKKGVLCEPRDISIVNSR